MFVPSHSQAAHTAVSSMLMRMSKLPASRCHRRREKRGQGRQARALSCLLHSHDVKLPCGAAQKAKLLMEQHLQVQRLLTIPMTTPSMVMTNSPSVARKRIQERCDYHHKNKKAAALFSFTLLADISRMAQESRPANPTVLQVSKRNLTHRAICCFTPAFSGGIWRSVVSHSCVIRSKAASCAINGP